MFSGLSTLRKQEEAGKPKQVSDQQKHLQSYLAAQYGATNTEGRKLEKRKKRKKEGTTDRIDAIKILDEDETGFSPDCHKLKPLRNDTHETEDEDDEEGEGGPLVANLEEAKRLKEIVNKERNGSGWEVIVDQTERNAEEPSPARRQHRHESPDDASPPRRQQRRESSDDASPPRRQQRRESSDDASPPRRRQRRESSDDASPPRRRQRRESPDDASPPRRPKEAIGDQKFMSDGTIAGMVAGTELAEEMARKREREAARFAALNAEVTGHGAATVYRNKITGKTMSRNEYEAQNISERQKKAAMYEDQSSLPWGGGLKQRDLAMTAQKRMSSESGRGYDVVAGMAESDRVAKEALRWGDPMAHLVKKKHVPTEVVDPLLARASDLKRAGFKIPLQIPPHSWLKRGVGPPLNRYNIKPGRHWDGVDRSNGFEKDLFKRQNELRAREAAAHMMAQEDM